MKILLDIVQDVLEKLGSDEVNSISDTIESEQIAGVVRTIYEQMVSEYDLPIKTKIYRPDSTTDYTDGITRMVLPSAVMSITRLEYDSRKSETGTPSYETIEIVDEVTFLDRTKNLDTTQATIESQIFPNTTLSFGIYNNKAPSFAVLTEQNTLVYNSYNSEVEDTLMQSKAIAYGQVGTELVIADDTTIDLPFELLTTLTANSIELAFDLYHGETPDKVKDLARNSRVRQQRAKQKLRNQSFTGPDYGRKSAKGGVSRDLGIDSGSSVPLPDYLKT